MVHHWKETGEVRGPDKRTENAFRRAVEGSGISRADLWPDGGTHEQGIALEVGGSRVATLRPVGCGPTGLPDSTMAGSWVTGTDDFQWWLFDDLWVDDLKTGRYYPDPETGANRFPQDVRSAQLKAYALAIATILEHRGDTLVSLTHWPRLPLANRMRAPERFWTRYTRNELDAFWDVLERVERERVSGESGNYTLTPGDHCRFCPSRAFCSESQTEF